MDKLPELLAPFASSNRIALKTVDGQSITYTKLHQAADQLGQQLLQLGIRAEDRVGLLLPKSTESVIAILALLKIRAVYVPVDIHSPVSRAAYIFQDSQVKAVLVAPTHRAQLQQELSLTGPVTGFQKWSFEYLAVESVPQLIDAAIQDGLAFILYTSGSTGQPKGVKISHQNALAFINWAQQQFQIGPHDILSSIAPFHFDLSVFDLYVSLGSEACLLLVDAAGSKNPLLLAEIIAQEKISVIYATPTLLQLLLNYGRLANYDFSNLQLLLYAGEVFPPVALSQLLDYWPEAQVYNLYGPTETNVVTFHQVQIDNSTSAIPIGKPCPYAECRLWQDNFLPQEAGQQGEIWVSGDSVALGYLGKDSRPAFCEVTGKTWYKTGDIARFDEQENLVFVGRIDRMIKRRGYRIELAEIENALLKHESIAEVAVVPHYNKKEELRLTAFYTLAESALPPDFMALKQFCKSYLPLYMEPDRFRLLKSMPKTSSQKVNFQSLLSLLA